MDTSGIHLWLILWKTFESVRTHAVRQIRDVGLGFSDFAVLEVLLHKGPTPVNTIGERVYLTSGSITAAVDRLEAKGINVALGHRGKLGLVASHGGRCAAIETDAMLRRGSLRESLRMHPELLRRLGWHYLRVHVFELFSDPDAVARRIVTLLGADPQPVTEPIPVVSGAR